jgi:hypothetical protein
LFGLAAQQQLCNADSGGSRKGSLGEGHFVSCAFVLNLCEERAAGACRSVCTNLPSDTRQIESSWLTHAGINQKRHLYVFQFCLYVCVMKTQSVFARLKCMFTSTSTGL